MKKILVVAAHPDDEILGVGGTICKHIACDDEVNICIVTHAYEPLWTKDYINQKIKEQRKVDSFLGINSRFNLDLPTVQLNTIPHGEFNSKINDVFKIVNPDIVYTHFEHDMNYDHNLVFNACMVATRPPKQIELYCMETVSETEWNNKPFVPNVWNVLSKECIEKKIDAFCIYESEVKEYPNPRSREGLIIKAKQRGMEICKKYAEVFIQVRRYL